MKNIKSINTAPSDAITEPGERRKLVKAMVAGGAISTSAFWAKPVVNSVLLPAHAQTSAPPSGDSLIMPSSSAVATEDGGVEVVVTDALANETVVVTAEVAAGASAVSVSVKADEKGMAVAKISRELIKSAAGRDLKAGETITVKAVASLSGRKASMSLRVAKAAVAPLVVSLEADADAGAALISVRAAKAGELVSAKLMVSGREIIVSGKASAEGIAKMEVSKDAIGRAGATLVRGEMISVTATAASGAKGSATAVVTGREAAALTLQSASGSMSTGISLVLTGAKASELVTLTARSGEKSLSFNMKSSETGELKTSIAIANLKELALKEGSEVALSVATASGQKASRSIKMAAASSRR